MDKNVGGPLAVDVLNLGGDWEPITDTLPQNPTLTALYLGGRNGDPVASDAIGDTIAGTVTYKYKGSGNISDDANLPDCGEVVNTYMVTEIKIDYSDNDWPQVVFSVHKHNNNNHETSYPTYQPTITLPGGRGVSELLTNSATATSAITKATYTLKCDHVDEDPGGTHVAGACYNGMETLELSHIGTPSLTTTGWHATNDPKTRAGTAFDTVASSLEKYVDRETTTTTTTA